MFIRTDLEKINNNYKKITGVFSELFNKERDIFILPLIIRERKNIYDIYQGSDRFVIKIYNVFENN